MTPLNAVPQSATRLGLPVIETPASVEIVDRKTIQDQGYRTTTETAQGAVGVLAGDSAGAPANFSMRGFAGPQVNVLYNGIWTGPADITSRWVDTANLGHVEFLKGPSSLMSGLNAIGGWTQFKTRFAESLEANASIGLDNGFADDFHDFIFPPTVSATTLRARNKMVFGNVIFRPKTYLILSPEYRRIWTWPIYGNVSTADIFTLSAGYKF